MVLLAVAAVTPLNLTLILRVMVVRVTLQWQKTLLG